MAGIEGLLHGLSVAFTPQALLFALVGTVVGTLIGVLPGIGPALTIALLLPMTYGMEPELAFIMFAGIYYGAMYGGSTTSILLKTPGESGSVITAIDGNKMARHGRGRKARCARLFRADGCRLSVGERTRGILAVARPDLDEPGSGRRPHRH